jgi:hypothetical protein
LLHFGKQFKMDCSTEERKSQVHRNISSSTEFGEDSLLLVLKVARDECSREDGLHICRELQEF